MEEKKEKKLEEIKEQIESYQHLREDKELIDKVVAAKEVGEEQHKLEMQPYPVNLSKQKFLLGNVHIPGIQSFNETFDQNGHLIHLELVSFNFPKYNNKSIFDIIIESNKELIISILDLEKEFRKNYNVKLLKADKNMNADNLVIIESFIFKVVK